MGSTQKAFVVDYICTLSLFPVRTVDDDELFGDHSQFSMSELVEISSFLNSLTFRLIMEDLSSVAFFTHAHALLVFLYIRNCRKPFTEQNHWLMKYEHYYLTVVVSLNFFLKLLGISSYPVLCMSCRLENLEPRNS